ncbi:MAG: glycosyltransferase family 2 protein [Sulfitobacter sp.]
MSVTSDLADANLQRSEQWASELTIGMPVFNAASYIEQALGSILNQTYSEFRLIISDNASTDGTMNIIDKMIANDPRVTVLRNTRNIDAPANFNAVVQKCETPYFMWAAGDDIWDKDWVKTLLPLAKTHQAVAFGQISIMRADGTPRPHPSAFRNLSFRGPRYVRRLMYFIDAGLLGKANPIYGIFPREMITPTALELLQTPQIGADVMFLYDVLKQAPILCDNNVTLYKRHHSKAEAMLTSSTLKRKWFRRTQLLQFWSASNSVERLGLLILYPFALLMTYIAKIRYLAKRLRHRLSKQNA